MPTNEALRVAVHEAVRTTNEGHQSSSASPAIMPSDGTPAERSALVRGTLLKGVSGGHDFYWWVPAGPHEVSLDFFVVPHCAGHEKSEISQNSVLKYSKKCSFFSLTDAPGRAARRPCGGVPPSSERLWYLPRAHAVFGQERAEAHLPKSLRSLGAADSREHPQHP